MAAGVTQPGGAGTTVFIYDDTHADAGGDGAYSFLDIITALDILNPGQTDILTITVSGRVQYYFAVRLQVGDSTTNAATTTLADTNVDVFFDGTNTLLYRATQTTSWNTILGTKVGSGNSAGSKNGCSIIQGTTSPTYRGVFKAYGTRLINAGSGVTTLSPADNSGAELIDCSIGNVGVATISPGSASFRFDNIYNCEFWGTPTAQLAINNGAISSDRITLIATAPTTFLLTAVASLTFKNWSFKGTPSQSDLRWSNQGATNWTLVRPVWSQNAAKFTQGNAGSMAVANGAKEYWQFNVKVVNASGTAIANIPVKVTDTLGNIQVNTTTDANGRVSFGSGATANCIIVMDHYTVTGTYNQRHRGPFLFEYNTGNSRNTDYQSLRGYSKWPGHETVTTTAGTFEDLNTVVHLQYAAGAPTTWVEREMP